jgi:hypothetical protein
MLSEYVKPSPADTDDAVVVDYGNLQPGQWMQNGFVFGSGPVLPGEIWIGEDAGVFEIEAYGAARRDPVWNGLKAAAETQSVEYDSDQKAGRIDWIQAGRTIRTPTFTVSDRGKVFLRVQGKANVYAAVSSHRMIAGPLHKGLIKRFDTKGKLQWVAHDLRRYKGLRAHLEITPADGRPFRLLAVTHDNSAYPDTDPAWPILVSGKPLKSPQDLAAAYQDTWKDALENFVAGRIATERLPRHNAAIVSWLVQNRQLFFDRESAAEKAIATAAADWQSARREIAATIKRESRLAPAMWEGDAENERLLIRGNWKNAGPAVPRRLLEVLEGKRDATPSVGSGRLELARQMVDPVINPLTPRVAVNRVWHQLFGRGIVRSVDNFGVLGTPPTHPELLDHLATEFVADDWSIKRLIRRVMLSRTYQLSSRPASELAARIDPTNRLLHRQRVRRLEGEAIRDSILAISGRLNLVMYGRSVPVHITRHMKARGLPKESGPRDGAGRRSVYLEVRRNFLSPFMLAFDTPIPFNTIGRRNVSNVPSQALILMNDPFVVDQARSWAARLLKDGTADPHQRITTAYETAFARPPNEIEIASAIKFLQQQAAQYGDDKDWKEHERAWADWCHILWNVKEFIYRS